MGYDAQLSGTQTERGMSGGKLSCGENVWGIVRVGNAWGNCPEEFPEGNERREIYTRLHKHM